MYVLFWFMLDNIFNSQHMAYELKQILFVTRKPENVLQTHQ